MKKSLLALLGFIGSLSAFAQEDLMAELDKEKTEPVPVFATFKSTRLINGQSVENVSPKHLDFRISHRFGYVSTGIDQFYGLDQASMRMGFEYGLSKRIMIGAGRTTIGKTVDGFVKAKIMKQSVGGKPVTIAYHGSTTVGTAKWADPTRTNYFTSRLNFCNQLLIARKFNDFFSLQLMPTHIHRNLVGRKKDPNDIFAMGAGCSVKLTRSTRFNIEYYPRLNGTSTNSVNGNVYNVYNALSVGFDIETGGHVFQLMFTNATGLIEQQFITDTQGSWNKGNMLFGFNISRIFSFDKKSDKDKKAW